MNAFSSRNLLVAAFAMVLLFAGTAIVFGGLFLLAVAFGRLDEPRESAIAVGIFYQVVVGKALAPQLLLTLVFHPLLGRWLERTRKTQSPLPRGELVRFTLLAVSSALAFCVVAPFLQMAELPSLPAFESTGSANPAWSFVLMTGTTALCAWLPEALPPLRSQPTTPGGRA